MIAIVVVGVLGGCSGDAPSVTSETTPPSPVTTATGAPAPTRSASAAPSEPYTVDQLFAAMPTDADLPSGYEMDQVSACPGDEACSTSDMPNANVLVRHSEHDGDWYALGVTEYPDAEAAASQVEASSNARSDENGSFDIPIEDRGDTYRPGRQGEGTIVDAEVDDWGGYRLLSTYHAIHRDGVVDVPATEGYLLLTSDSTMLSVQITVPGEDTQAVSDRLDDYARSIIDRLP